LLFHQKNFQVMGLVSLNRIFSFREQSLDPLLHLLQTKVS
jgi:hypothetical protein